jgi:hypothetical protein
MSTPGVLDLLERLDAEHKPGQHLDRGQLRRRYPNGRVRMESANRIAAVLLALAASVGPGCKASRESANLAKAGTTYAAAMDSLLVAAATIEIDTTSERLLQDDALSNQTLSQYQNLSGEDEKLLQVITQLRAHVALLARYFELLLRLATSDAPARIGEAIGDDKSGVIGNLNTVSAGLRSSGFIGPTGAAVAGPISSVVVGGLIRGALKDELNARKDTIQKELLLQEQLLQALSDRITHDLEITKETREQRLVIGPLTAAAPISDPDVWIVNRRSVLTMKMTAEQLTTASADVRKLREAFEDFVAGKLTFERVDSLLTDFNTLLTIAETLKKE